MNTDDLKDVQKQVEALLADIAGDQAAQEAHAIVQAAGMSHPDDIATGAIEMARRRLEGAPLGLLIGRQRFLGIELLTGSDVLVPREETELLGREVIAILNAKAAETPAQELRLIDMGCGSGNITCAAAMVVSGLRVWASDITESCATLTRANVDMLALSGRVEVTQGDLFEPLRGRGLEATIDVVAMNPPYIPTANLEKKRSELLRHEPRAAFDGGPFGISIKSRLVREAYAFLREGGYLIFEFGIGQNRQVSSLVERAHLYAEMRFALDSHGEPRVAVLKK